jgi:type VI secretion system protein ImpE
MIKATVTAVKPSAPVEQLRQGDPSGALKSLQNLVRSNPADAKLRIFTFQLLCVLGEWDRALNQLNVIRDLDGTAIPMVQTYHEAIACERLREQVFAGTKTPLLFGEPDAWLALLIEALLREGRGDAEGGKVLRAQAFEAAPATSGILDGAAFQWIADGDSRLGPVLEAIVNGRYYWVPFARLQHLRFEAPADLRDSVWMPAYLEFVNGGEVAALIPTRYPGSASAEDGLIKLSRKTAWTEAAPDVWHGLGQRVFNTDAAEFALMDVREIRLGAA